MGNSVGLMCLNLQFSPSKRQNYLVLKLSESQSLQNSIQVSLVHTKLFYRIIHRKKNVQVFRLPDWNLCTSKLHSSFFANFLDNRNTRQFTSKFFWPLYFPKGQIEPKADWRAIGSSKNRMKEFVFCQDSLEIHAWNLKFPFKVSSISGL